MEELRGKDNPKNKKLMEWGKVALYTGALVEMYAMPTLKHNLRKLVI